MNLPQVTTQVGTEAALCKRFLDTLYFSKDPAADMERLRIEGIVAKVCPELAETWGPEGAQDPRFHPEGHVWNHILKVLDGLKDNFDPVVRLAALFHDISKPLTFHAWPSGGISNHGHDQAGARVFMRSIAPRLGIPSSVAEPVSFLIANHMTMHKMRTAKPEVLEFVLSHPYIHQLVELNRADVWGTGQSAEARRARDNSKWIRERLRGRGLLLPAVRTPEPEVITEKAWKLPRAILITQCLQKDFLKLLGPGERQPNLVHVGRSEAARLMGPTGTLLHFLQIAHAVSPDDLAIIHMVDMHNPVLHKDHLKRFKSHTIEGTPGAELVGAVQELAEGRPNTYFVRAGEMSDLHDSQLLGVLRTLLEGRDLSDVAFGVIGEWTDFKVNYLLYDLRCHFGAQRLATCSCLTASNSMQRHFHALEHIGNMLGVKVMHSAHSFLQWLHPEVAVGIPSVGPAEVRYAAGTGAPRSWSEPILQERDVLISHLGEPGETLELKALNGGFSDGQALLCRSRNGASVIKVGRREEIARERFGNELVARVLGDVVPKLMSYREGDALAAMKIALADSIAPNTTAPQTFQSLAQRDLSENATAILEATLEEVLDRAMGRLYRHAQYETVELLSAWGFTDSDGQPMFKESVGRNAEAVAAENGIPGMAQLLAQDLAGEPYLNPVDFYTQWLPGRAVIHETFAGNVHADLNLANILLSYVLGDSKPSSKWIIDFARLTRLPILTDFAKVENDLSYIVLPVRDGTEFERAKDLHRIRLASPTLEVENFPSMAQSPEELRFTRLIRKVRAIAHAIDPRGVEAMEEYRIALLRYCAHTLGFGEPTSLQRRLALLDTARLVHAIVRDESAER